MGQRYVRPLLPLVPPVFTKEEILENEWIAGFADGDGYLYVKGNECNFEVAQANHNIHLLEFLKSKFGGRIGQPKQIILKGGKTFFYRVSAKGPMTKLAFMLNGNVRGTSRNEQFQRLCQLLNISYLPPVMLNKASAWYAGIFDADGSILGLGEKRFIMTLLVTSKYSADVEFYLKDFGGRVRKNGPNAFIWVVQSKAEVLSFANYLKAIPLRSNKKIRVDLVDEYYELTRKKPLAKDSPYYQDWLALRERWYANGADIYRKDCKGRPFTAKAREERELAALKLEKEE